MPGSTVTALVISSQYNSAWEASRLFRRGGGSYVCSKESLSRLPPLLAHHLASRAGISPCTCPARQVIDQLLPARIPCCRGRNMAQDEGFRDMVARCLVLGNGVQGALWGYTDACCNDQDHPSCLKVAQVQVIGQGFPFTSLYAIFSTQPFCKISHRYANLQLRCSLGHSIQLRERDMIVSVFQLTWR